MSTILEGLSLVQPDRVMSNSKLQTDPCFKLPFMNSYVLMRNCCSSRHIGQFISDYKLQPLTIVSSKVNIFPIVYNVSTLVVKTKTFELMNGTRSNSCIHHL
jgi:hypothetical protein